MCKNEAKKNRSYYEDNKQSDQKSDSIKGSDERYIKTVGVGQGITFYIQNLDYICGKGSERS